MSMASWETARIIETGPVLERLGSVHPYTEDLTGTESELRPNVKQLADMAISLSMELDMPVTAFLVQGYPLHDSALRLIDEQS